MADSGTELERWLAGGDVFDEQFSGADDWVAGFDADRQAVVFKLGPFKRLFLRPQKFTKRFYHQLYPLAIENWPYRRQLKLFDDFCTVDIELALRFQATLAYVHRNSELLPNLNRHIKLTYADRLQEIIDRESRNLDDGVWVQTGLAAMEKTIANSIRELLATQLIQSQALCSIKVVFEEFPNVQPGPNNVYLHVLKKTFEINERKSRELGRQQRLLEQQELEEKQRRLEHIGQLAELELQAQALEAEKNRRLLEEKQDQLVRQLALEKRLHAEQIQHEAQLKEMAMDSELRIRELLQAKQRQLETRLLGDQLAHGAQMREMKISAGIQLEEEAGDIPHTNDPTIYADDEGGGA